MIRQDLLRNFCFELEIDGIIQAGFSEVTIGELAIDPIDYREGGRRNRIHKITGMNKSTDVTMKRGVVHAPALAAWLASVGQPPRSKPHARVRIHLTDDAGHHVVTMDIIGAVPVKIVAPDLNGKGADVAIELLELANEGVRCVGS
jgi:phage tail-like protein